MRRVRKEVGCLAAVFLLLCIVSAYWQIGKSLYPADSVRPVVIYFVYVLLLAIWWATIHNRVTQRNMRVFLTASNACMLFGMTVRFIQEAFWHHFFENALTSSDTFLMRLSGYSTCIAFVLIPIFGLYASFGLGKTEEYRFNRKWYYLLIPAVMLAIMVLTNDLHHLAFLPLQDETDFFRYYRPHVGLYLIIAWAFLLLLIRIFILHHKSREAGGRAFIRLVPLLFTIMVILVNIPYITSSFMPKFELMEQEALLFFLEVLVWESCILVGMVPVNKHYDEVFDRSTVAMLIVDDKGKTYLESSGAPAVSTEMFEALKQQSIVRTQKGQDLHLNSIRGGYAVWLSDVSETVAVIEELRESAEMLEREGVLLSQELAARSDEAAVKEQNRIYNCLTIEVGPQLLLLRKLLGSREKSEDKAMLFKTICLVGAYVKRRCNLRLVEQSERIISNQELDMCFSEIIGCLEQMGVEANAVWHTETPLAPEFAIFALDVFEFLLEYEHFKLHSIQASFDTDTSFSIRLHPANTGRPIPVDEIRRINKENYSVKWLSLVNGYRVVVRQLAAIFE